MTNVYTCPGKDAVLWFIARHWEWEEKDVVLLAPALSSKGQTYMGSHLAFTI